PRRQRRGVAREAFAGVDVDEVVRRAVELGEAQRRHVSAEFRREALAADQVLERLALPYNVVARTVNQHGRGTGPRVVVRGHHVAVGAGAHDGEEVAGRGLLELAVPGEEVAALAYRPHDVGDDGGSAARTYRLDRLVGAVERRPHEIVH